MNSVWILPTTWFLNVCWFFLVVSLPIDFKTAEQAVSATTIGALIGTITGTAIVLPVIPNSKINRKASIPRQTFEALIYFFLRLFHAFISSSRYLYLSVMRFILNSSIYLRCITWLHSCARYVVVILVTAIQAKHHDPHNPNHTLSIAWLGFFHSSRLCTLNKECQSIG